MTRGGRVSQFAYRFLCADGGYRWLEWGRPVASVDAARYFAG